PTDQLLCKIELCLIPNLEVVCTRVSCWQLKHVARDRRIWSKRIWIRIGINAVFDVKNCAVGFDPHNVYRKLHVFHPKRILAFDRENKKHAFVGRERCATAKPLFACGFGISNTHIDRLITYHNPVLPRMTVSNVPKRRRNDEPSEYRPRN